MHTEVDEDEIDLREVFRTIHYYRYMIIFMVVLFTISSAVYAYFQPNVYQSTSTIEVKEENKQMGSEDILAAAMDTSSVNLDTEIVILKSASMADKALKKVDLAHRYYTTRRLKEVELYKGSPFQVGMLKGFGIFFSLIPVDDKNYRLVVEERKDENKQVWSYDTIQPYDKDIITEHFHLNVIKKGEMTDAEYRFVIIDPAKMGRLAQEGISVAAASKKASVLSITYKDNVALRAKEFTNALAEAYVGKSIEMKNREAELKLNFIDSQIAKVNENLRASAVKLEDFKKSSNTLNISSKAESMLSQMNTYQTQFTEISIRQKMLDSLYRKILKSDKEIENISIAGLNMQLDQSALSDLIKELQGAIVKKKILREDYTEVHPLMRKLNFKIKQLRKSILSSIKGFSEGITQNKLLLEQSIAKQQKILNTLPANERAYGELQRKFTVNEKMYSYLLEKESEVGIIKASTVSNNIIVDKAYYPEFPIKPKRKLIVLVGIILGFILGIALAFLRAFLDDRIKTEDDIIHATSVPILGAIPNIKEGADTLKVFSSPKSSVAESFRNMRTNLQFMPREGNAHVIAVTSTVGGEGKTTVSINLAGIMSMSGKKTILLNLDMRKPTLHEKFGISNTYGMSNFLSKTTKLNDIIQHTQYENLDVITSGPVPPNPSELIQNELMEKVIKKLKEVYDVIILDTPPVGLVTDARALMHYSDTSIYVLRSNYSKKVYFKNINNLAKEEIHNFGILLNAVDMANAGYGYYGYGYYEEEVGRK
jgi:capsular exopolysaccharide synthesis family protein